MNACQLALRTAAHARDYRTIERLIDAGATVADLLHWSFTTLRESAAHCFLRSCSVLRQLTMTFPWLAPSSGRCDLEQRCLMTERSSHFISARFCGASYYSTISSMKLPRPKNKHLGGFDGENFYAAVSVLFGNDQHEKLDII